MHISLPLSRRDDSRLTPRMFSVPRLLLLCLTILSVALLFVELGRADQDIRLIGAVVDGDCCPLAKALKRHWGPQRHLICECTERRDKQQQTTQQRQVPTPAAAIAVQTDDAPKTKWQTLFDGKTLAGWKISKFGGEGEAKVVDGVIALETGVTLSGITCTKDFPKMDYEIEYEAKRTKGIDFFGGLTFPFGETHCSFIAAGWGGSVTGLSTIDDMDASENTTTTFQKFEQNQWYKFRVRVTKEAIQCWIDDKQVVDQKIGEEKVSIRPEVERSKPLGFAAWQSSAALRNIRWRNLKAD